MPPESTGSGGGHEGENAEMTNPFRLWHTAARADGAAGGCPGLCLLTQTLYYVPIHP